jgi:hypothetical protein
MCFNAAQSWQLGWYSDKAVTLDKTNKLSHVGVLGGISDYSDSNNIVLVKLNNLNTGKSAYDDYYVNFNRQSGINSGTQEGGDQITVVQGGEGTGYAETDLVAKLSAGEEYTIINFDGSGETATITVNTIGKTADVSICIGPCPALTPPPTQSPTASPVMTTIPGDVVPSCQLGKFLEFCTYNRDCCSGRCVSKVCRTSPTSGRASRTKLAGRGRGGAAGLALKTSGGGRIRG